MMESMYITVVKMLLVIIVFAAAAMLFYRYRDKLPNIAAIGAAHKKTHGLQKVETVHLGYKKFISVLEIKNRTLVVGIGEKEISLLAQWENEENHS
jgi:flagellar biogenesis protein FliO